MQGRLADSWTIRGLQPNNYYATAEVPVGIPLQLDQLPNDYITFHPDTLKLSPVNPKDVIVPEGCAEKCPLTSVCTILQMQARAKTALGWFDGALGRKQQTNARALGQSGGKPVVM
jgi:hypothetical protein